MEPKNKIDLDDLRSCGQRCNMKNGKELLLFEDSSGVGIYYPNGEEIYYIPDEYRTLLKIKGKGEDFKHLTWTLKNLIKDSIDINDLKRKLGLNK